MPDYGSPVDMQHTFFCVSSETPSESSTTPSSESSTPSDSSTVAPYSVVAVLSFNDLSAADVVEADLYDAIAATTSEEFEIVSYTDASLLVNVNFFFELLETAETFYEDAATTLGTIEYMGAVPTVEAEEVIVHTEVNLFSNRFILTVS